MTRGLIVHAARSHRDSQLFLKQLLMMTSLQVLLCDLKISPQNRSFLCTQNFKGFEIFISCVIIIQCFKQNPNKRCASKHFLLQE